MDYQACLFKLEVTVLQFSPAMGIRPLLRGVLTWVDQQQVGGTVE